MIIFLLQTASHCPKNKVQTPTLGLQNLSWVDPASSFLFNPYLHQTSFQPSRKQLFVPQSDKDRWETLVCPHITCSLTSFVPIAPRPTDREELSNTALFSLQFHPIGLPFSILLHPSPPCESRCKPVQNVFVVASVQNGRLLKYRIEP